MTRTQVIERSGVYLQVEYTDGDKPFTFNTIRVLDGSYRPCGPNLVPLLDPMLVLVDVELDAQPGDSPLAERLLSTFIDEVNS